MIFTINHHPHADPVATYGWADASERPTPRPDNRAARKYRAAVTMVVSRPQWLRLPRSIVVDTLREKTRCSLDVARTAYDEAKAIIEEAAGIFRGEA